MRGAFNKDTENQYKYSSPHTPFKHASLAWSPKPLSEEGRDTQTGRDRGRERVQRGLDWFGVVLNSFKRSVSKLAV